MAQGRHLGQHPDGAGRCATTATPTRSSPSSSPAGPACHTGARTCFHNGDPCEPPFAVLPELERTIAERADPAPARAPTPTTLLAEPGLAGEKVQEEAEEVVRAAREESDERVAEEAADVLYHLAVLMRGRGLSLADAERVLDGRRGR